MNTRTRKRQTRLQVLDGKYINLKDGKAVILIAIGVDDKGNWGIADAILAEEENTYWKLLIRIWIKYNIQFIVSDLHKSIDGAILGIKVIRQPCLVHLKRNMSKEERKGSTCYRL